MIFRTEALSNCIVTRFGALVWCGAGALLFVFFSALAYAVKVPRVTLLLSEPSGAYQEVADAIRARLEREPIKIHVLTKAAQAAANGCDLIVPIGSKALQSIAELAPSTAVLATLVPRQFFENVSARYRGDFSAVVLDQPLSRQLRLVRIALPDAKRIGALLGPDSIPLAPLLAAEARRLGLETVWKKVDSQPELLPALQQVLAESDVLIAIPDRVVSSRDTLHSLLLTSYRYHDPVVGFSAAYGRAGALLSVYTTPAQAAQQTAETILAWANGKSFPTIQPPKYFTVDVNSQVARSLGLKLPDEAWLGEMLSR